MDHVRSEISFASSLSREDILCALYHLLEMKSDLKDDILLPAFHAGEKISESLWSMWFIESKES